MWCHIKQILQIIILATLFTCDGIGKSNKMLLYFLFSSYHISRIQQSDKNISTHTRMNFQILPWSKSKVLAFFVVFLFSIPHCAKKWNQEILKNCACVNASQLMQTLYWRRFVQSCQLSLILQETSSWKSASLGSATWWITMSWNLVIGKIFGYQWMSKVWLTSG